jgi:hypothetical protein
MRDGLFEGEAMQRLRDYAMHHSTNVEDRADLVSRAGGRRRPKLQIRLIGLFPC